ncbi:IS66 family transposase [Raineya sp.]
MELPDDIVGLRSMLLQVLKELESAKAEIAQLKLENAVLKAENAELRSRLGMNSSNSHKPPSSDRYKNIKKFSAFERGEGKRRGGQEGHKGNTLQKVSIPDEVIVHQAEQCKVCGRKFSLEEASELVCSRQVFDIPEPKFQVIEHQVRGIRCCGLFQAGEFPLDITAPVQYGKRIKTLVSMLSVGYSMPYCKISQLTEDLFGQAVNARVLIEANEELYEKMKGIEEQIKEEVLNSSVAHFDETGVRTSGKTYWIHTASTERCTYLFAHEQRGEEALRSHSSLLSRFEGCAVHDCWKSYFSFGRVKHVLCNAHILRELNALIENGSVWAKAMQDLLLEAYRRHREGKLADISLQASYEAICQQAEQEEPLPETRSRGRPKNSKGRNLLNRLKAHQASVLAFAFEKGIPFTNNLAEQDIRCVKIKQKIAMCFRTFEGLKVYVRIKGVIKTFIKKGLNVFQNLLKINLNQKIDLAT